MGKIGLLFFENMILYLRALTTVNVHALIFEDALSFRK